MHSPVLLESAPTLHFHHGCKIQQPLDKFPHKMFPRMSEKCNCKVQKQLKKLIKNKLNKMRK